MEILSPEQKERVLRMILKAKKKRKVQRVVPGLEVDGKPSQDFIESTNHLDYRNKSEDVRESLLNLVTIYSKEHNRSKVQE